MDKKKQHRNGELQAMYFDKLPQRAKEIYFEFINDDSVREEYRLRFNHVNGFFYGEAESPIEVILNFAFDIEIFKRLDELCGIYLLPQMTVNAGDKTYRIDLLFDTDECESPYLHFEKSLKLCIECDGHEFHEKTKKQVEKRNERDMDLKKSGYDIIHYSGSQIYKDPLGCANEIIDYILSQTL